MGKGIDKQANTNWEEYRLNLLKETTVDINETQAEKLKRIKKLEADDEAWFAYYFPNYYKNEPAQFHVKASKRLLSPNVMRWYEVRAWSRGLAKTTRAMMEFIKLAMTGRIRNTLIISNSYDNAERLSMPFRINLESNQRLINDYGTQERPGNWEDGEFITRKGWSVRAVGAGQSPRGTKNEEARPDSILVDDIDTDEETRNAERIDTKWAWLEKAVIPTVDISGTIFVLFCGNIIAKHCCITEAIKKADFVDVINIRDKKGNSSWPEKNSEDDIDYILSKISYAAAQQEYYNNPVREGSVFKNITWGEVPPLHKFKFLVAYGDPSPSNKENKDGSYKAIPLLGWYESKLYILTCYLEQAKNSTFINWYFDLESYVGGKAPIYNLVENNTLQEPFYEQVLTPLLLKEGIARQHFVNVSPDERKKPDKYTRIEANLEPLNRTGRIIFNIDEANNPHMQRLEEQFKAVDPKLSAHADGPDAVEGGYWIINNKLAAIGDAIISGRHKQNSKRY